MSNRSDWIYDILKREQEIRKMELEIILKKYKIKLIKMRMLLNEEEESDEIPTNDHQNNNEDETMEMDDYEKL